MLKKDKRGQISETLTWVVATLIIVVLLSVSVFLASLVGKDKSLPISYKSDLLVKKSLTSYLLTEDADGVSVYEQILRDGDLTDFSGNLASDIFTGIFGELYRTSTFLGVRDFSSSTAHPNGYFESSSVVLGNALKVSPVAVFYLINLNNNKLVQLVLWRTSQ